MAQSLELNIKTTSDVPQAMNKAKQATDGFGKQVQDIQKKFSMAFKDIFLSFLGPMALLGVAINFIGRKIEENQKKRSEANQAAIDETNELMSAEDRYWARKQDREKKSKEQVEQSQLQRQVTVEEFLSKDPRGQAITRRENELAGDLSTLGSVKTPKQIEEEVKAIIAEDIKKNPITSTEAAKKSADFKGPEGFGNVIGVGANPVLEAQAAQLEETRKTNALLEKIAGDPGATSWMNSAPSRAALLMGR